MVTFFVANIVVSPTVYPAWIVTGTSPETSEVERTPLLVTMAYSELLLQLVLLVTVWALPSLKSAVAVKSAMLFSMT